MTATVSQLGNDLHSGTRAVPIVRRRRTWYLISVVVLLILAAGSLLRGPNLGIDFTGGSEFQVAGVTATDSAIGRDVVREHLPENEPKITVLGGDTMRIQTEQLDSGETAELATDLAAAYGVEESAVSTSYVGPVWSTSITEQMLRGVVVFLLLVAVVMALYFRNLKASVAAMAALVHDMLLTVGVYLVIGFEVTPGTVIGFLTIMGYSLYDTIVVFDKVRENTRDLTSQTTSTYPERVERAANQTLMRSLNTSIVALLPVGSILAIGALLLGAGTLKDISLALFVGILAGTYSSIFLAPGFLVDLRRGEPEIREHTAAVEARRHPERADEAAGSDEGADRGDAAGDATERDETVDDPGPVGNDGSTLTGALEDDADDLEDPSDREEDVEPGPARQPRQQPRRTTRRRRRGASR